jgi:PAS domain-containing protein
MDENDGHKDRVPCATRHNRERANDTRLMWSALDAANLPAHGIMPEGRILFVDDSAYASLGYTRDESLWVTVADVDPDCPVDSRQAHRDRLKHVDDVPRTTGSFEGPSYARKDRGRLLQDGERYRAERRACPS